jgi:hypothetical protein
MQERRDRAASIVFDLLKTTDTPEPSVADDISEIKGLFTRSCKQDQWDWFTVWTQLGRPGRKCSRSISNALGELRQAVIIQDTESITSLRRQLRQVGAVVCLHRFLNPRPGEYFGADGIGYIYILSVRSNPLMLKIGYTERTVEQRVKEINSATGIVEPYGVRAVWIVSKAPLMEKVIHDALAEYRVRGDREFFELAYGTAFKIIGNIVHGSRREL